MGDQKHLVVGAKIKQQKPREVLMQGPCMRRKHRESKNYHGDPGPGTEKEEETGSLGLHQVPTTLGERCSDFQQGGGVHDLIDASHLAAVEREHVQG